jgi:hypothetical protein
MTEEPENKKTPAAKWIKRFGLAGFLFFLIKGLIWLALFVAATYFGVNLFN